MDLVDAQSISHGFGRRVAIARRHDDPNACFMQHADRVGCGVLDGVGHRENASKSPVDRKVDDARALGTQLFGVRC